MSHDHHDAPRNPPLAVVAVVTDAAGRVLMGLRGPEVAAPGRWSLPGGFVSFGEDPNDALAREVAEETGLTVADAELLDATLNASDPAKPVVVLTYAVTAAGVPSPGDDFVEVGWFAPDALPPLAFGVDRGRIAQSVSDGTSHPGPGGS